MGDQRPLDRPGRIDMEAAELAAQAGPGVGSEDVFGAHRSLINRSHVPRSGQRAWRDDRHRPALRLLRRSDRRPALPMGARSSARAAILPAPPISSSQTVELAPGFAAAWFALGEIRDRLGDRSGAVAAFERPAMPIPRITTAPGFSWRGSASGDVTPAMTETYVRRLFDQYAARFDAALTERLAYRGPEILRDAVGAVMRAAGRPHAVRLDARPRLRHRARRRRVSAVRRLARRRRSVAGDGRAGGGQRPLRPARDAPTCSAFSPPKPRARRAIISSSPPMSSSM